MALCLRKNRESITKLNPYSSCCFCRGWWERVFYSFPPWWDDCSLLARKKFRYRRMTFVLKIVLPFLLPDYPLFEISGYSYVYTPNTPPSNSILILFHVINRSLSLSFSSLHFSLFLFLREAISFANFNKFQQLLCVNFSTPKRTSLPKFETHYDPYSSSWLRKRKISSTCK